MTVSIVSAARYGTEQLASLMTASFEGYFVPVRMDAATYAVHVSSAGVNLERSLVITSDGEPCGLLELAPAGDRSRIAAMGVTAAARGRGLGHRLLDAAIRQCTDDGFRQVVLEVIEVNTPALALYRRAGFERVRRLVGFRRVEIRPRDDAPTRTDALAPFDLDAYERILAKESDADLPSPLAPATLVRQCPPAVVRTLDGKAFASWVCANDFVSLQSVVVPRPLRRQGWGGRLIRAAVAHEHACEWRFAPWLPEGAFDGFLEACGFEPAEITQLEMRLEL